MAYNDHSPSGAAPVRARSNAIQWTGASEEVPPRRHGALDPETQNLRDAPLPAPAAQFRAGISDDLRVPWGWLEVALFVILGVIGSVVVTWGMAHVAVRFLGVNSNEECLGRR